VACLGEFDIREAARFEGLGGTVAALAFSPDGRTLATADRAGALHFWDHAGLRHLTTVAAPGGRTDDGPALAFQPAGGGLAVATADHRVAFLDPAGRPAPRPPIEGGPAQAHGLAVDRRGRRLAVGWDDGRVDVFDGEATAPVRSFTTGDPRVLALSPDGRWLALTGADGTLRLHATDRPDPPTALGSSRHPILALAFSPDGRSLAGASRDHTATIWDLDRRQARLTLRGHKEKVTGVAFSPDGDLIATTSDDHTTRIWEAHDGQAVTVLPGPWFMKAAAFSPDGRFLAASAGTDAGTVCLYQLATRRGRVRLVGHELGARSLAFHPRLARLASGADDCRIILWDPGKGRELRRWPGAHPTSVTALAFSPDGALLASGNGRGADGSTVRLRDVQAAAPPRDLTGHRDGLLALAFDPPGRRLASGDGSGTVLVWDLATGRVLRRLPDGPGAIRAIAFLDAGRHLLAGIEHRGLVLHDLEGTEPPRPAPIPGRLRSLVVSPRRDRAVVGDSDGGLTAFALPALSPGRGLARAHDRAVSSLALSPDGRWLASGGDDRRVVLRDARTLRPIFAFPARTGAVRALAFDATGTYLAVAGVDSEIAVWDLGLVRDELAAVGLGWDPPDAEVVSAADAVDDDRAAAPVPVVRPGQAAPAR
jgi:WD40 repeat protein